MGDLTANTPKGALKVSTDATTASEQPVVHLQEGLPDGRKLVVAGRARGSQIEVTPSAFSVLHGVRSEAQFKAAKAAAGELTWSMIMGQASVDEQVEALRYLHDLGSGSGYVIDRGLVIPDWTSALPPDVRDKAPKGTSFVLDASPTTYASRRQRQSSPGSTTGILALPTASRTRLRPCRPEVPIMVSSPSTPGTCR